MGEFKLLINGKSVTIEEPGDMPLLWVIRDILGLTGTKYGCGIGQCRACTVHVDGAAVFSCMIRAADVLGSAITTIEGIGAEALHPIQTAWIAEEVPQCGYCQSGQIMSAVALLAQNPAPSDADIDAAMVGNICRCGTYSRIRRAIHRAADAK